MRAPRRWQRRGGRRCGSCMLLVVLGLLLALGMGGCGRNGGEEEDGHEQEQRAMDPAKLAPRPTTFPAMPAAPKPAGPLPEDASCVTAECHATFAMSAAIHGPVAERACDACHAADTGAHSYPLLRTGNEMCTRCHAVAGTMSNQHKAVDQGCMTCHDPHASKTKFLLKADTVEQMCATCHDVPLKRFAHEPFAKGQCSLCHEPHQSQTASLLRGGDGSKHCFMCHERLEMDMKSADYVHEPAKTACTNCHNPHASDFAHELKASVQQTCQGCHEPVKQRAAAAKFAHGAMDDQRSCANCHNPHASRQARLLPARMDTVCLTCHDKELTSPDGRPVANMKPVLTESKFLHGPVKTGDCAACHDSHGGPNVALLTKPAPRRFYSPFDLDEYALCFSCHEKDLVLTKETDTLTNFRDGRVNLHYLHVNRDEKGRTCKTCHEVHGSDQPNHMASGVPFEGSNWAMPIRYNKTETGGSCTPGCHTEKRYRRDGANGDEMTRGGP